MSTRETSFSSCVHSCLYRGAMVLAAASLLCGCSEVPSLPSLTPYKIDIQQGNFVTQEMVAKLKPGMTPAQVRFILGTPLVVDAFHKDRWDYVYRYSKAGRLQETRRIVVVFHDDKLVRIEGDVVPAQAGGITEGGVTIRKPAEVSVPGGPAADTAEGRSARTEADGSGKDAKPSSTKPEKPAGGPPKEERGFFGRLLDQLGF